MHNRPTGGFKFPHKSWECKKRYAKSRCAKLRFVSGAAACTFVKPLSKSASEMERREDEQRDYMKRITRMCTVVMLACTFAFAREHRLKVYVSVDMEGIGGVSTWTVQAAPGGREYEKFCRLMTEEVNAAIAGAYDAGATDVLVSDSHGSGSAQNIDLELLDQRAQLVRAWPRPLQMMQGIDDTFAAVVFIGYHAREGQVNAGLPHTFTGRLEAKLNGITTSEAGFNAAIAGDFGVPVVFLSGDQTAGQETQQLLGLIETVAVKEAGGYFSATMMHPEESQRLIRAGVKRGVEHRGQIKPYQLARPVELELKFFDVVDAEMLSCLAGIERPQGDTIVFKARDMAQAAKFLTALQFLNDLENH
jgi:D-amino peptidase